MFSSLVEETETLKARIADALALVTDEVLKSAWQESENRLDVLWAANRTRADMYIKSCDKVCRKHCIVFASNDGKILCSPCCIKKYMVD